MDRTERCVLLSLHLACHQKPQKNKMTVTDYLKYILHFEMHLKVL